jgi:integrase/recombinase XerC
VTDNGVADRGRRVRCVILRREGDELGSELAVIDEVGPAQFPGVVGFNLYAAVMAGRSARTASGHASDFRAFAEFLGASTPGEALDRLTSASHGTANALASAFKAHLLGRGLAAATIARRLAALRSGVAVARRLGVVAWTLDIDSPKSVAYRHTAGPGSANYKDMLAVVQGEAARGLASGFRDVALLRCLHDLGLRRGEAVSLDVGDLDLVGSTASVIGKGKTEPVKLTLPGPTRKALATWIESRGLGGVDVPLFVRMDRAKDDGEPSRLSGDGVRVIVASIARRAGLAGVVRPHGLRHLAVTEALDATRGDFRKVAKFSRHAKINMVLR